MITYWKCFKPERTKSNAGERTNEDKMKLFGGRMWN
jgi:hypothetical protein